MGIDTSIYANLLRPPKSVAEYDQEAMAGEQNKLMMMLQRQKADEYTRGIADEQAQRAAVAGFGSDQNANLNMLYKTGNLKAAQAYEKSNADIGKVKADTEKEHLIAVKDRWALLNNAIAGSVDQNTYSMNRQALAQQGIDVAGIPEQFDPAFIANAKQQALTEMQRADQMWKQKGYDLDVRQQGEVELNNKAQRANSAGNLAVSQGNLGLSRERLAMDKAKPKGDAAVMQKPMPTSALKMQQAELDAIGIASGIQADLGAVEKQINDGKLDFGPINNLVDRGRNLAGMSNEASRNKASFKSTLEKLRNDSLRLNAGVQTDGDAQRAWSELFENINDKGVVQQRLAEIKRLNARAVKMRKMNVDGIRANYGRDPADTSGYEVQEPVLGETKLPGGWTVKEN